MQGKVFRFNEPQPVFEDEKSKAPLNRHNPVIHRSTFGEIVGTVTLGSASFLSVIRDGDPRRRVLAFFEHEGTIE